MRKSRFCLAAGAALAAAVGFGPAALADPCDGIRKGMTLIHYETGSVATSAEDQQKLREFADIARYRDEVCVLGQVDAQGSEARNKQLAKARAESIAGLLVHFGVPRDKIIIATQDKGFTLWGLLEEDQQADRRVTVTYR